MCASLNAENTRRRKVQVGVTKHNANGRWLMSSSDMPIQTNGSIQRRSPILSAQGIG